MTHYLSLEIILKQVSKLYSNKAYTTSVSKYNILSKMIIVNLHFPNFSKMKRFIIHFNFIFHKTLVFLGHPIFQLFYTSIFILSSNFILNILYFSRFYRI